MPTHILHNLDGKEAEVSNKAANAHAAVNDGLNALALFACTRLPPPGQVSIKVMDADRAHLATLGMSFSIDYGNGVVV